MQLRDLRTVIAHLRSEKYAEIAVRGWVEEARGTVEAGEGRDDPAESDVVAREYVEPLGAVLAQLVEVFEDVEVVGECDGMGVLGGHVVDWPMDVVVPGMGSMI